jgi:hypothetical protein
MLNVLSACNAKKVVREDSPSIFLRDALLMMERSADWSDLISFKEENPGKPSRRALFSIRLWLCVSKFPRWILGCQMH